MVVYDALYAWCRSCQKKPTAGRRKSDLAAFRTRAREKNLNFDKVVRQLKRQGKI
jgi:hypothetical protein